MIEQIRLEWLHRRGLSWWNVHNLWRLNCWHKFRRLAISIELFLKNQSSTPQLVTVYHDRQMHEISGSCYMVKELGTIFNGRLIFVQLHFLKQIFHELLSYLLTLRYNRPPPRAGCKFWLLFMGPLHQNAHQADTACSTASSTPPAATSVSMLPDALAFGLDRRPFNPSFCRRWTSKWISKAVMSAGFTPPILEACPMFWGRIYTSTSKNSVRWSTFPSGDNYDYCKCKHQESDLDSNLPAPCK